MIAGRRNRVRAELRHEWLRAFVVGELIGFIPPAVTGTALAGVRASDVTMVLGLTAAGLAEGAALGETQGRVLRAYVPSIDPGAWRAATMVAAGFAWFVGMGGGALMGSGSAPGWALALLVPLWVAPLLGMGYLQWRVMRRSIPRSLRWVWVTAAAWLVGVSIPVVALSVVPTGWPLPVHVVVGVAAAIAMGIAVGRITAGTLESLLPEEIPSA